jgi:dTMP kinase
MNLNWIVFEAGDGAGKSTQVDMLADFYKEKRKLNPIVCKQPGNTKLGNTLRTVLLSDGYDGHICPEAERLLFAADNAQFIEEIIKPAKNNGSIIIQDRYTPYSNFVYGYYGNNIKEKKFFDLIEVATKGYYPDLVFILDLDPKEAINRMNSRGRLAKTRIDKMDLDFHQRVREGYLELAKNDDKFKVIDASKNKNLIHEEIIQIIFDIENELK